MKKLLKIVTLTLVFVLCLFSVACSSYGKIEKALNDAGYAAIKVEDNAEAEKMKSESDIAVTIHVFSNKDTVTVAEIAKINAVFVFEFNATEDMKAYYEDSATMQGLVKDVQEEGSAEEFYNDLKEKGLVNGNCLVFGVNPLCAQAIADLVKNA